MAKSTKSGARPVAIELLAADHRKVEALFKQYEEAKDGDDDEKQEIAEQICNELTVHAQVEEEIFYPFLRENLPDEDVEMLEEAYVEHSTLKDLVGQIEDAASPDETYDAKVKVLSEYVKHHVKEEEGEMFGKCAEFKEELDELGQQMHARKSELRAELGLTEEGEEAAMPAAARGKDGKQRPRAASRGR